MKPIRWTLTGTAAAVVYTATVLVGGAITPGYSHTRDHVSTLLQAGAANAPLLISPFLIYNVLTITMGFAVLAVAREASARGRRRGMLAGVALIVEGIAGAATLAFPQDQIGVTVTATGATHIVLAGVSSLLTLIAVGLGGVWLLALPGGRAGAWYSFGTLVIIFVGGGVTAMATANLDPSMGLYERVAIFGFVQWLFVFGLLLWRPLTIAGQTAATTNPEGRLGAASR